MERFVKEAHRQGKRVRFFCIERDISKESALNTIHIGDQPVWDASVWPRNLSKKLRDQLRRARTNAIVHTRLASTEEIEDRSHPTRRAIEAVFNRWLDSRRSAPMGFLIGLDPFHLAGERRVFLAENPEGQVVGMMVALPIYARNGWFIDHMLRDPSAPNGTVELMFDCAMRTLAAEGSTYVTLGLSPFVGVSSRFIQVIRDTFGFLYNFNGLYAFKTKLRPASWEPVYLAYPKNERGISAIFDAMTAFLSGGWLRYAWDSAVHRARQTAAVNAAALLPWTLLLAFANTERWFPSSAVHAAWVGLDVVMMALLLALYRRWSRALALVVVGLTACNLALSGVQLALYNASHAQLSDWPWMLASIFGPLLVGSVTWCSRNRADFYVSKDAPPAPAPRPATAPKLAEHAGLARGARVAAEPVEPAARPSVGSLSA